MSAYLPIIHPGVYKESVFQKGLLRDWKRKERKLGASLGAASQGRRQGEVLVARCLLRGGSMGDWGERGSRILPLVPILVGGFFSPLGNDFDSRLDKLREIHLQVRRKVESEINGFRLHSEYADLGACSFREEAEGGQETQLVKGSLGAMIRQVTHAERIDGTRRSSSLHSVDSQNLTGLLKKMEAVEDGGADLDGQNSGQSELL